MEHEEHLKHVETIYFLEWLSKESGFTENQLLSNMKPENQKWNDYNSYNSIEEFLKIKSDTSNWIIALFTWGRSFLKPDYNFWRNLDIKWYNLVKANEYNFEFSRYPIENWRIMKSTKKIKVKSKKLKI